VVDNEGMGKKKSKGSSHSSSFKSLFEEAFGALWKFRRQVVAKGLDKGDMGKN
jgi:hypothetical protein